MTERKSWIEGKKLINSGEFDTAEFVVKLKRDKEILWNIKLLPKRLQRYLNSLLLASEQPEYNS